MTSEALKALAERVEGATGPDWHLDEDILRTLGWSIRRKSALGITGRTSGSYRAFPPGSKSENGVPIPKITSSIDAALGLVERTYSRELHFIELSIQQQAHCEIHDQRAFDALASAEAPTAPLALCLALLRALLAKGE